MPRDAWPSAMPSRLPSDRAGSNSIAPRVFSGTATTACAACTSSPARVSTSTVSPRCLIAATGVSRRVSNRACDAIASSSAAGAARQRHPASGVLGKRQAVARERVPAKNADRPGVVQPAVGQRLQLSPQHVALFRVELELVDPLGDRKRVEAGQQVDRAAAGRGGSAAPARPRSRTPSQPRFAIASRSAMVPLRRSLADVPGGHVGIARQLARQARPV